MHGIGSTTMQKQYVQSNTTLFECWVSGKTNGDEVGRMLAHEASCVPCKRAGHSSCS